jgi:zinc D-Ala-D-Ala carboxypeptidase
MKLSTNFSLSEMTKSQTAIRKDIDNTPTQEHINNLKYVAENLLQPIRDHFGKPVAVSSGYRSVALCEAIGSSSNSQHAKGEAADFEIPGMDNKELGLWIRKNIEYDQLILEFYKDGEPNSGWIHCSMVKDCEPRKSTLQAIKIGGKTQYIAWAFLDPVS